MIIIHEQGIRFYLEDRGQQTVTRSYRVASEETGDQDWIGPLLPTKVLSGRAHRGWNQSLGQQIWAH